MGQHVLLRKTRSPTKKWRDARVVCTFLQLATCLCLLNIAWLCGERASAHAQPETLETQAHCLIGRPDTGLKTCAKVWVGKPTQ